MKRLELDNNGLQLSDHEDDKEISLHLDKNKNVKVKLSIRGDSFKDIFKRIFGGKDGKVK